MPPQPNSSFDGIKRPGWKLPGFYAAGSLRKNSLNSTNNSNLAATTRQCHFQVARGCFCKSWTNVGEDYCAAHRYQIAAIDRMWEQAISPVPSKKETA